MAYTQAKRRTVDEHFAIEQLLLTPLPDEPFETGRLFTPRVDRYSQITIRTHSIRPCSRYRASRYLSAQVMPAD
ncbi:hypothetical protein T261_2215 [Streptomyces lydicus]|nr:hypothetical protein T261_2215 [Streptomyces lydicus]